MSRFNHKQALRACGLSILWTAALLLIVVGGMVLFNYSPIALSVSLAVIGLTNVYIFNGIVE